MNEVIEVTAEKAESFGVSKTRAEQIESVFLPMVAKLKEFDADYAEVMKAADQGIDKDVCKKASRLRKDIAKVRNEVERTRKSEKEEFLRAGKAIDGLANNFKFAVSEQEKSLGAIENHFENLERERIAKLTQERQEEIALYGMLETDHLKLGEMPDDAWNTFLTGARATHEQKIAAEKKAEEERIAKEKAEAEERERIRVENEKLKAEAAEEKKRQEAEAAERKRVEDERIAKEKAEQAKRDEALRIEREEAAKKQKAIEKKLAAEKAERKRIEDEKRKEAEEIERAKQAAEEAKAKEQAELEAAGDKEKIAVFVQALRDLYKTIPKLNDKKLEKQLQDKITEISKLCK